MLLNSIPPDHYTFPLVLKACSHELGLNMGLQIGLMTHSLALKLGFDSDMYVQNTLLRFYGGFGHVDQALKVFDEMPQRDAVSWSAIIACFASNGLDSEALSAFRTMRVYADVTPDEVLMVSVISAVASVGTPELGVWVHCYILRRGFDLTVSMGTALVVMLSNCGCMDRAAWVFDRMPERNVRTWTALIKGYAAHGRSKDALGAFHHMTEDGFGPDHVTFIGVLTACSHGGLLDEGWRLFESIRNKHGMEPRTEHYGCMVDLMGRAGLLEEAYEFIKRMPIRPNSVIWRTLLGACVSHGNVVLAEQVKERVIELEPGHDGDFVLLSNVYGGIGRWVDKAGVRHTMRDRGIAKRAGCSLIAF